MKTNETSTSTQALFAPREPDESASSFREKFEQQPFLFHHQLSEDHRFELDRIRALARRLPQKARFNGSLPVDKGFNQPSVKRLSFEETLDGLESGQSWIILKKVHNDPEYGPLLRQCLSEVEERAHRRLEPLIESRTMSLILSSPGQVTPYHVDADCNFLFQIRGNKMFYVFNGRDRSVLSEQEEEGFWAGNLNAAHYREENQAKAWPFGLKPGNGVHVPVMFPHWVKNDDNVSVSLSINFRFLGRLRGDIYQTNHFMRKMGFRPRAVGESKLADSVKALVIRPRQIGIRMFRQIRQRLP